MFGAQGALMPELFGAQHRYTGVSMARETSAVIAGGVAPLIGSLLLSWFADSWVPIAIYLMLLTLITIATTFFTPETRDRDLDSDLDAIDELRGSAATADPTDAAPTAHCDASRVPAVR